MNKIINNKHEYNKRAKLGSSRTKPVKLNTTRGLKSREKYIIDKNGYFDWTNNNPPKE